MDHTHAPEPDETLPDGAYLASCKEKTLILADVNGHGAIFPHAACEVRDGTAYFYRDDQVIWSCTAAYALTRLVMERLR